MKNITLIITALIFAFSLNSTAQKVTIDLDKDADFSKYKSFVFDGWQEALTKSSMNLTKRISKMPIGLK